MINIELLLIILPIVLFSLTVHEFSHAYSALLLGDSTAKSLGRLTLNPLKHLDLLGTLAIIFIGIGWAKPVPVVMRNLKNGRKSLYIVAFAGPLSNFIIASFFALIFNLLPIPPLDGGNIIYSFLPDKIADKYDYYLRKYSIFLIIALFFLIKSYSFILLSPINLIVDLLIPNAIFFL